MFPFGIHCLNVTKSNENYTNRTIMSYKKRIVTTIISKYIWMRNNSIWSSFLLWDTISTDPTSETIRIEQKRLSSININFFVGKSIKKPFTSTHFVIIGKIKVDFEKSMQHLCIYKESFVWLFKTLMTCKKLKDSTGNCDGTLHFQINICYKICRAN